MSRSGANTKNNENEDNVESVEKKEDNKTNRNGKKVLSELVEESDAKYTKIILELSRSGLLKQYEDELALKGKVEIEPTITENEFNKILSGR